MILSDRTIREPLAAGRIVIDPRDESLIQPSSIDVCISDLWAPEPRGVSGRQETLENLVARHIERTR